MKFREIFESVAKRKKLISKEIERIDKLQDEKEIQKAWDDLFKEYGHLEVGMAQI